MADDLTALVTQIFTVMQQATPERRVELQASLRDLKENSPLRRRPEVEAALAKKSR